MTQLTRLQQSEFFRRIICLFMTICSEHKSNRSQDYIQNVFNEILQIFDTLIEETNQSFSDLYSAYSCGKSLWICSQTSISNNFYSDTYQRSETFSLINMNRSVRKHLLTTLTMYDLFDLFCYFSL